MSKDNLDFDGMAGTGVNRSGNKYSGNYHGGKAGGNYGMGPRVGNKTGDEAGAATSKGGKINGGAVAKCPSNYDKINVGSGPRKGNE